MLRKHLKWVSPLAQGVSGGTKSKVEKSKISSFKERPSLKWHLGWIEIFIRVEERNRNRMRPYGYITGGAYGAEDEEGVCAFERKC